MMNRLLYILLIFLVSMRFGFSQVGNNMCEGALPFCTGTSYSFPAGVNAGAGQTGPYYDCLTTRPNPAWYYMRIALPGLIQISMHSEPAHDIDFCCWGPFDSQNACGQLTAAKVVDCSYSPAAQEVVDIANAVQGKYYILIITNYSNLPCNIIFSQTGGQGKTDCTILPPAAGNDGPLCVGETLHLAAANMNNAVYHWTGPDGWTSNVQNPSRSNVQLNMAGVYSLFVTVNGQPSADTNYTSVGIYSKPTATLTGGEAICNGDSTKLTITCQNHPPWTVVYSANGQNPVTVPITTSPYNFWVHPSVTTTYAITSVGNEICTGVASGTALVSVNPNPLANFTIDNDCSGYPTLFNDATNILGGTVTAWHWDFGVAGDTSNIQNPTYIYQNGGTYNVSLWVTSNSGCEGHITKPILIKPTPIVSAGDDKSIPYGTNTTLQGSASGGSGTYSYHWEPANLLVDATVANPTTVNLSSTTDFTLTVTDIGNSCVKSDVMTLTITGGPMGVQLTAEPMAICHGSSTVINTQVGGGSGNYSYIWTSEPPGFNSTLEDITVQPDVTTTYKLEATDGFSIINKSIVITIYPDPVSTPGASVTIANGTYTVLSGSGTSATLPITYSWTPENMVTNPLNGTTATVILSNTTNFTLTVTDGHGCTASNDLLVTIIGGPLQVKPEAVSPICKGESTTLHPMAAGGSGDYSYTWSTDGVTFSTSSDPVVTPSVTTTYKLVINDGFTQNFGTKEVVVNPLPVIHLIPAGSHIIGTDTMVACATDTITLNAANLNSEYLWSNGATTPEITSQTTGLAFDMLSYSVTVNNKLTSCSNSANVTIIFDYGECSFGIPDNIGNSSIDILPNPNHGFFHCRIKSDQKELNAEIYDLKGVLVKKQHLRLTSSIMESFPFDISGKPSGIYFLKLYNNDFLHVIRIVKL
ncbi:MAG: T9SS type A sorting domain-containing protein [Bacteroidetes bacterium]|nr:T9SS type A sorting domain-containing protein [Bacteroidota bacterium]